MHIRFATINDVDAIAAINYTSWQETYRGIMDDSILEAMNMDEIRDKWRSFFNGNPYKILLVVENQNNEVIGYCCGGPSSKSYYNFQSEVYALYLLKQYQGQGWGSQLFSSSMKELCKIGFKSYGLLVLKDNHLSVNFYHLFNPDSEQLVKSKVGSFEYDHIIMGWNSLENFKP